MPISMKMTIIAQDPSAWRPDGSILRAEVDVPYGAWPRDLPAARRESSTPTPPSVPYHPSASPNDAHPFGRIPGRNALSDAKVRAKLHGATAQSLRMLFRHGGPKQQREMPLLLTKKGRHDGVPSPLLAGVLDTEAILDSTRGRLSASAETYE
jgi:hypothetical protein